MTEDRVLDLQAVHDWSKEHGFGYSLPAIRQQVATGKLEAQRGPDGRKWFVRLSTLEKWFKGGKR